MICNELPQFQFGRSFSNENPAIQYPLSATLETNSELKSDRITLKNNRSPESSLLPPRIKLRSEH